jgi:micrococcal nuclease
MPKRFYAFVATLFTIAAVAVGLILQDKNARVSAEQTEQKIERIEIKTQFSSSTNSPTNATVIRVVDGDTFVVKLDAEPGEWTIRMLGIDTPEIVDPRKPVQCFGKEASQKQKELTDDKRVRLESDPSADERDKYDRLLRNVFLEDGTDVNAFMVLNGYAHAYLSFPLNPARKKALRLFEEEAKREKRGLWADGVCE